MVVGGEGEEVDEDGEDDGGEGDGARAQPYDYMIFQTHAWLGNIIFAGQVGEGDDG